MRIRALCQVLMLGAGALLLVGTPRAESLPRDTQLPDPVAATFKANFPRAQIERIDVTEENGVMVYDIEFQDGKMERETDIAEDGTMMEFTDVIPLKAIPAAPLKAIRKAAQGAKLGRLERIEVSYETRDGKVVKLPEAVTRFAAEMSRKGQHAEVIVGVDGAVVEAPVWVDDEEEQPATGAKAH